MTDQEGNGMTITGGDDLRAEIRSLAEHEPDPSVVAEKILNRLTSDEANAIVPVTLPGFVRTVMVNSARGVHGPTGSHEYTTNDGRRTPSAQTAAIRDWVATALRRPVNVSGDDREWKFLGDCSREECLTLADNRHRKASEVEAEAQRFDRIAEAMAENEAEMVRELPRSVLAELLRR